jgi:hypothetical protein
VLEIGISRPIPDVARQLLPTIGGSVHFALQKHNLPEAELLQILLIGLHLSSPFQASSAIDKGMFSR